MSSVPSVDLSENRQPELYAAAILPCFFALVCVVLRYWCRWIKGVGFWLDDWLVAFALLCAIGLTANEFWWIPRSVGKHIQVFGPDVVKDWYIGFFLCELTYTGVIVFVKLAILALYWRIFSKNSSIKLPIAILTVAVLMWGIAVFLLVLLQCIPTRYLWDKTIEGSCNVDSLKFLFAISVPNILIDIALLALPIPYVIKLNVSKSQKKAILSIFLLGGFVIIASILRLYAVLTQPSNDDLSWNVVNQSIWATTEAGVAIISACLPTLRPLWIAIRKQNFRNISEPPSYNPAILTPRRKRLPQSFGMSLLKSRSDQVDTSNFMPTSRDNIIDTQNALVPEPQPVQVANVVPLSTNESQENQLHATHTIRVENSWAVEYNQSV
ncbi:hypothetical protein F4778DRAFT_720642 [Xylariomycetidae sp. FL2044]|nr:hypothetical protein F4778DRAFT_720642 [Xylariomycetidae sp. FL2044]